MKHTPPITVILVLTFLVSQIVGLAIVNKYIDFEQTTPEQIATGNVTWEALPYNLERPQVEESSSFFYILAAILIGTGLVLVLVRFRRMNLWKFWFFLSVLVTLSIAFSSFIPQKIAFVLALALAAYKVMKPNVIVHNITEVFVYGGLAAIFVPILNLFWVFMLLLAISIYDMYAVWKSKHMVKIAKFQSESNVFAGFFIPYKRQPALKPENKKTPVKLAQSETKNAILGGGDVGFPLIFAGVVMKSFGFFPALIIPLFVSIALLILFLKSEKDKFYPAMPFLTMGCIAGYLAVLLISLI